ncbi:hypothetical protein L484_014945 [Morus notabilis]|uniref:Glucan endo-1,3-beta-D-glucosidase n=1 Tax=Morus notabilis TaxID=981085 RepID=W9R9T6_9ROSA|nr:hypothetical protein L484_014945 [Morus notabilis]
MVISNALGSYIIGVNGDNHPPAKEVKNLCGRCQLNFLRIFEPIIEVHEAVYGNPFSVAIAHQGHNGHFLHRPIGLLPRLLFGAFLPKAAPILKDIVEIVWHHQASPVLINVYPHFAYASDPEHIHYAQFKADKPVIGWPNTQVAVAETGWPSAGNGPHTSVERAKWTCNKNLFESCFGNLKPAGVEQNFGFFYPNMKPVYPLWPC